MKQRRDAERDLLLMLIGYDAAEKVIEQKDKEIAALRRDAERYRWLRSNAVHTWLEQWIETGDKLDAIVDAAMREDKP